MLNASAVEYVHCMRAEEFWCVSVQCSKRHVLKINEFRLLRAAVKVQSFLRSIERIFIQLIDFYSMMYFSLLMRFVIDFYPW
jgi:hypothetical protein